MRRALAAVVLAFVGLGPAVAATPQTYVVNTPDGKIVYFADGGGPAVVMIPSLGRAAEDFDDLSRRLVQAGYRTLRIQPRGIGGSVGPMTGVTLRDLTDDIARAVVLGHDDGNRVARAVAAYHPKLVKAVILVGAGGKVLPDPVAAAALRGVFDSALGPDDHLKDVQVAFFAPGNDPSVWRDGWHADTAQMERAAVSATPLKDWWSAGSAPILVVQAVQDRIAPPANADLLKADVGDRAEIVRIDHAGHALLPEQPAAVAAAVIDYLNRKDLP